MYGSLQPAADRPTTWDDAVSTSSSVTWQSPVVRPAEGARSVKAAIPLRPGSVAVKVACAPGAGPTDSWGPATAAEGHSPWSEAT